MTTAVAEPLEKFLSVLDMQSRLTIEGTFVESRTIRRWCEALKREQPNARTHRLGRKWRIDHAELVEFMRRA